MSSTFWLALLIVLTTVILMLAVYLRLLRLHILLEEFYLHHWFSWTGTFFIAFFTPAYSILKRRRPTKLRALLNIHVLGNLISVMLISIHFTQQITRPPQSYPELGTGIALYITMLALVSTGFLLRFGSARTPSKAARFVHTGISLSFYVIIGIHILHGLNMI